jgi:hypothetical protein
MGRADQLRDLGLHQLLHQPAKRIAHQVGARLVLQQILTTSSAVILSISAIVVSPFVDLVEQTDDHGRRGGRNFLSELIPSDAVPHHYPGRDLPAKRSAPPRSCSCA